MPSLVLAEGFDYGTTAGLITGNAGNRIADVVHGTLDTNVLVTSAAARTGGYGLRVSHTSSASARGVGWNTDTLGTGNTVLVAAVWLRVPDTVGVDLITVHSAATQQVLQVRCSSAQAITMIVAGTSSPSVEINAGAEAWFLFEFRLDVSTTTIRADWRINGNAKTQATGTGVASTIATVVLGMTTPATTATTDIDYDDFVLSVTSADYPLGNHKVVQLLPDQAGSLDTSTITASEWNTFAGATPTLSAWDAATALAAIDEVPVGLGASADGLCRIAGTDADYVGIPMTSYTLAAGEALAGLRMLACCWAAAATANTHSFVSYNGTTATTLLAAADVGTDNSATAPAWVAKMCTLADFDTQAELDALQFRFGSTDTNPDAGIHWIGAAAAIKINFVEQVFGTAPDITVTNRIDPLYDTIIDYTVTTPPERGVQFHLLVSGSPIDRTIAANSTHTETLNTAVANVTEVGIAASG